VLLLADDFYFVAHDSISMKCQLPDRVLRFGLAAALLGEQALYLTINFRAGQLRIVERPPLPKESLARAIFDLLRTNWHITSVRYWLRYLSAGSYEHVVQRLTRAGLLRAREERRLFRTVVVHGPTRATPVGAAEGRLASGLGKRHTLDLPDLVLAGLVEATGLDERLLAGTPPKTRKYLDELLAGLPPGLSNLIEETRAAVADAVLSGQV
jgi:hypothetical protein